MKSLEELRARLDVIDRELLQLVAERQTLGKQIAEVKRSAGQPTREMLDTLAGDVRGHLTLAAGVLADLRPRSRSGTPSKHPTS